jgi:hypothetical protein
LSKENRAPLFTETRLVSGETTGSPIELRVENVSQLFDTLDPFPFAERDLDKDAEEFIVGWARELPAHQKITVVIHLPESEMARREVPMLAEAIQHYFSYRTSVIARDLKELFRVGRTALVIGLTVLAACLTASQVVAARLGEAPYARFVEESLIILGWVANWKPLEIFLYDWWPLVRRRNLYRRLAASSIEIRPYSRAVR